MTWLVTIGLVNAVLAAVLGMGAYCLGRWSKRPALAHVLWLLVLAKLLTPPLFEIPTGWEIDPAVLAQPGNLVPFAAGPTAAVVASDAVTTSEPSMARTAAPHAEMAPLAAALVGPPPQPSPLWQALTSPAFWMATGCAIWLAGSAACVLLFAYRAVRFQWYLARAGRPDEALQSRVARLARSADMPTYPQVVVVESVISPMLWGLGHGVRLVFPAALARQLERPACDSLLLHELAHYSRGDHWVRLLELAVQVLYWWHPLVYWARHKIEEAEEECCDAWVLERQAGTRRNYAEALLATIDFICDEPRVLPPAACGLGEAALLRGRLRQIMRGEVATRLPVAVKVVIFSAAALMLPIGPGLLGSSSRQAILPEVTLPVTIASVSNAQDTTSTSTRSARGQSTVATPSSALPKGSLVDVIEQHHAQRALRSRLWATAISPDGRIRLEVRSGGKVTLVSDQWASPGLDMTSHGIAFVSFSPDSRTFYSGHADGIVRAWDSETAGTLASFRGSTAGIVSVAASPDGLYVAAGAQDGSAVVWDVHTRDEVARLEPQEMPVACLRWSQDGQRLAVALGSYSEHATGGTIIVWVPAEGAIVNEVALSLPAGALSFAADDRALLAATWDGNATLIDLATGSPLSQPVELGPNRKNVVSAAWWSPDCLLLPRGAADALFVGNEP